MSNSDIEEDSIANFHGVYMLNSQSEEKRYKGKCYIGYTVNPKRRVKQHNGGIDLGGARKTNNKGPWIMIMIVHGFPNSVAALQFEWAWQQPTLSTRLKNFPELKRKQSKESYVQYHIRILNSLLMVGPWNRLPLTIRWLEPEFRSDFAAYLPLPRHIQIAFGDIKIVKLSTKQIELSEEILALKCCLCMHSIEDKSERLGCLNRDCNLNCHTICLAEHFLNNESVVYNHYIPIDGNCPLCDKYLIWGELIQRQREIKDCVNSVNLEEITFRD